MVAERVGTVAYTKPYQRSYLFEKIRRVFIWLTYQHLIASMAGNYVTSENNLPEDPAGEETTLQISDERTKEISSVRARIDKDPDNLTDPDTLTVVKGPHENTEEEWYIDIIETDEGEDIDLELLEATTRALEEESTVINTRSKEVKTLLQYLTEKGEFQSVSEASRTIMLQHLSENYPNLVSEYIDLKVQSERTDLAEELYDHE